MIPRDIGAEGMCGTWNESHLEKEYLVSRESHPTYLFILGPT